MTSNSFRCDCNTINHELVQSVVSKMPEDKTFLMLEEFYKIMGNATRLKIIYALSESEMCVCDLANVLSMSKSSVSHQLGKMRELGVVKFRREGKTVYYSLDDKHIADIFSISLTHINHTNQNQEV